jgi:predicted dienelactone hydrolase
LPATCHAAKQLLDIWFFQHPMRLPEAILIFVVFAAAVMRMTKLAVRWPVYLTLLGLALAAWHILGEGTYWQMFPALTALALLLLWLSTPVAHWAPRHPAMKNLLALLIGALSFASFALLLLVPMFSLPKPTGPYPVGTRIIYLKDPSRMEDHLSQPGTPRELMVQIWYPALPSKNHLAAYQREPETSLATSYRNVLWTNSRLEAPIATGTAPFSVLLFNHRWEGVRTQETFLTEELASHGYVVAAIDHTYNAGRVEMPDGRILKDVFRNDQIDPSIHTTDQILNVWNKELKEWVADQVFVLTALQNENLDTKSFWYGRLDTNRAGALGHSFGGAASVQVCSVDPRIRAGLNMDGWTFGDIRHRASNQPIMFMYGPKGIPRPQDLTSSNPTARTEAELDVTDTQQINSSLKQYGGYRLFVAKTTHMDFSDHSLISPWRNWTERGHIAPARIQTIVRAYVLAFFDQTIRGEKPALLQPGNSSPFPEVEIEQFTPESNTAAALIPTPTLNR